MAKDDRLTVPLVMLPGNMEILLKHTIHCDGVSLKRDSKSNNGVILVVHGLSDEAKELGFQTRPTE